MSRSTVAGKSALVAAATAMSAAGLLALPSLAQADQTCTQYAAKGQISLRQSNGYEVFFGANGTSFSGMKATAKPTSGGASDHGTVNGGIQNRHLDFTIQWNGGAVGHYEGDVEDNEHANGYTVDLVNGGPKASWSSGPLVCVAHEPTASARPAPAQPAPTPKSATVTNDVDVFNIAHNDVPDANGVQGVKIGRLRAGQQVGLDKPCKPNDWCHVLGSGVPNGSGFVLGNLQF